MTPFEPFPEDPPEPGFLPDPGNSGSVLDGDEAPAGPQNVWRKAFRRVSPRRLQARMVGRSNSFTLDVTDDGKQVVASVAATYRLTPRRRRWLSNMLKIYALAALFWFLTCVGIDPRSFDPWHQPTPAVSEDHTTL